MPDGCHYNMKAGFLGGDGDGGGGDNEEGRCSDAQPKTKPKNDRSKGKHIRGRGAGFSSKKIHCSENRMHRENSQEPSPCERALAFSTPGSCLNLRRRCGACDLLFCFRVLRHRRSLLLRELLPGHFARRLRPARLHILLLLLLLRSDLPCIVRSNLRLASCSY